MRRLLRAMFVFVLLAAARVSAADVPVLAYHDIVSTRNGDAYAITVKEFEAHMAYLRDAGYTPIDVNSLEAARAGRAQLPAKPVLLTFDDGYKSFYRHAFPTLKRYGYPAVVSIVTSWIDGRATPDYVAAEFMTWDDLREITRSPLVEVFSHSDDLHSMAPANAFGARTPAGITRVYDAKRKTYEADDAHRARVTADLARSVKRIQAELGAAPRGVTWPYGKYEQVLIDAAAQLGMRYHLTLDPQPARIADLPRINRATFRDYRGLADLGDALTFKLYRREQLRFVEIDLAPLAAHRASERADRIVELARRIALLRVDAVVVRPFTSDGKRAYFYNRAVPIEGDLLSQVAYQLSNRAGLYHLYLSIPAAARPSAFRDLARLNWFSGVAFDDAGDAALDRAAAVFRYYKPAARIGVRARTPPSSAVDFVLVDMALTPAVGDKALKARVAALVGAAPRPLFLLQRTTGTNEAALRDAMAAVRAAGGAHYGYGPDDYERNMPAPPAIIRSLTEHTITHTER